MSARAKSPPAATRPATKERCGSPDPPRSGASGWSGDPPPADRSNRFAQELDVVGVAFSGGLDDRVAAGVADDAGDHVRVDLTVGQVGVPVGPGVERVAAVVGVDEVDAAGDRPHPIDDAVKLLAAGVRVAGIEDEAGIELADHVP